MPASCRPRSRLLSGGPVDRAALLADVLEAIERRYQAFERTASRASSATNCAGDG